MTTYPNRGDDVLVDADWMPDDFAGYPGRLIDWWNGWVCWDCTRDVAERVAADQNALYESDPEMYPSTFRWEGDVLIRHDHDREDEPDAHDDRMGPTADGRYSFGWDWCWTIHQSTMEALNP